MPTKPAVITKRGDSLARCILPFYKSSKRHDHIRAVCSVIARHATTHCKLQELVCSVEMSERQAARVSRRDDAIEARIRALVETLPKPSGRGPITVEFSGDPRGFTVKLVVPGDKGGNTWGLDGRYGI